MSDYTPIDCGLHSQYELAVMHRRRLRVSWRDAAGDSCMQVLVPRDLQTRAGAEYLIGETLDGRRLELRLDHILRAEPL